MLREERVWILEWLREGMNSIKKEMKFKKTHKNKIKDSSIDIKGTDLKNV